MRPYKSSIEEMRQLAHQNQGECLSQEYKGVEHKLTWQCRYGHIWDSIPTNVRRGHWCPSCGWMSMGKKRQKYHLEDIQRLATARSGKCLSTEYLGYGIDHEWQCADGHMWNAPPDRIIQGKWCPKCAKRKHFTEEKCRFIIEQMTGLEFPSDRKILNNGQELDLFNERHNFAIEYHGVQHYKFVKNWHKDAAGFQRSQERDNRKVRLCKQLGVKLFVISYKQSKTDDSLIAVLRDIVREMNLPIMQKCVDLAGFYDKLSSLKELIKIARDREGKCLSKHIDREAKCKFQCKKGHVFNMEPRHVKSGHWCNECGNIRTGNKNRKWSLSDAHLAASQHLGKCLSTSYRQSNHKLKWQCSEGHVWKASFSQVRSGHWCNECGYKSAGEKMRGSIDKAQSAANQKGGQCLNPGDYVNNRTRLEFECLEGHRWLARPVNIQQGKWCPKCSYRERSRKMLLAKRKLRPRNNEKEALTKECVNATIRNQEKCDGRCI